MKSTVDEIGLPPAGHNLPPSPLVERARDLVDNANRWLVERPTITDAEMAGKAQEFIEQLRQARDDMDVALKAEIRPHNDAIAEIKGRWFQPAELVRIALTKIGPLVTDWLSREKLRLIAEKVERQRQAEQAMDRAVRAQTEAERPGASVDAQLAADQAMRAADDAVERVTDLPARAHAKGDYGSRAMTLKGTWAARITDEQAALKHYSSHHDVRGAMMIAVAKAATREAKATKDPSRAPPGVEFYVVEKAV